MAPSKAARWHLLLDTRAAEGRPRHVTLRHLIVGVSRATHQDFVHVAASEYAKNLMLHARQYGERPMCSGGDTFNYADVDLEDDGNDLALYFNDPDEVPAVSVLSLMNAVEATPVVAHLLGLTPTSTSSSTTRASLRKQ